MNLRSKQMVICGYYIYNFFIATNFAKETIYTDNVFQLDTKFNKQLWADIALKSFAESDRYNINLYKSSHLFDIKEVASNLQKFYYEIW